jgi:hypothetical protein
MQCPEPLECEAPLLAKEEILGKKMADRIPPWIRLPRNRKGSLTCRKSATRDPRLYFPSEGRHAENFLRPKKNTRWLWPGLNSQTRVPEASMLTTRPLKPLGLLVVHHWEIAMYICNNWYVLYVLVNCQ